MSEKMFLIGLSGKKRIGKDTVGHYLELKYGFQRIAFADPVKQIARSMGWNGLKDEEGRKLLQNVGEIGRSYNNRIWVDLALARMLELTNLGYSKFVFTDMRYENELEEIQALGGSVVRLWGAHQINDDSHASEVALDNYGSWDYLVESHLGDFNHLYNQIDNMMQGIEESKQVITERSENKVGF